MLFRSAQFVHNSWPSATTGLSPFELLIGFIPSSGGEAVSAGDLPALEQRKAYLGQLRDRAQEAILNAQKLLTLYHEKNKGKGRFVPYMVGQKVWLEGTNLRLVLRSSPKRSQSRILVSEGYLVRVSHVSVNPSCHVSKWTES